MSNDDENPNSSEAEFPRDFDERVSGLSEVAEAEATLADEHLRQIGRIAVGFSFLELAAQLVLFGLIHPEDNERGIALVGGDSLDLQLKRIDRLVRVNHDVDQQARKDIATWLEQVNNVKDERNRVLHSVWLGVPSLERVLTFSFRRGRSRIAVHSTSELGDLAEIYERLSAAGFELAFRVRGGELPVVVDPDELDGPS
jgi:hypothetical protein